MKRKKKKKKTNYRRIDDVFEINLLLFLVFRTAGTDVQADNANHNFELPPAHADTIRRSLLAQSKWIAIDDIQRHPIPYVHKRPEVYFSRLVFERVQKDKSLSASHGGLVIAQQCVYTLCYIISYSRPLQCNGIECRARRGGKQTFSRYFNFECRGDWIPSVRISSPALLPTTPLTTTCLPQRWCARVRELNAPTTWRP